jgi:hypothetical protein
MTPEVHEDVLHDVLGSRRIADDLPRGRMDGRPEVVEDLGQCAIVSGRQPGCEEGVGGPHGADRTAAVPDATPTTPPGPATVGVSVGVDIGRLHASGTSPRRPTDHLVLGDPPTAAAAH